LFEKRLLCAKRGSTWKKIGLKGRGRDDIYERDEKPFFLGKNRG
jgi:hypothetical protein